MTSPFDWVGFGVGWSGSSWGLGGPPGVVRRDGDSGGSGCGCVGSGVAGVFGLPGPGLTPSKLTYLVRTNQVRESETRTRRNRPPKLTVRCWVYYLEEHTFAFFSRHHC